jgi:hypothetical protein
MRNLSCAVRFLVLSSLHRTLAFSSIHVSTTVDYTAANEYMEAHYGISNYFHHDRHSDAPIFDARQGFIEEKKGRVPAILEQKGFQMETIRSEDNLEIDWSDTEQIKALYLPLLGDMLRQNLDGSLSHILFWNPMRRGQDLELDPIAKTSPIASLVHIDTDVNAYTEQDFCNLIVKNTIHCCVSSEENQQQVETAEQLSALLQEDHRFAIVNCWRNIDTEHPVQRAPLAVFQPRYNQYHCTDDSSLPPIFPLAKPDPTESRWFVFPKLRNDEVLLFKQYDRLSSKTSDIWHCALADYDRDTDSTAQGTPPSSLLRKRQSFDIRAFCIFHEKVPVEEDRYNKRVPVLLTLEESGCFCNEQDEKFSSQK